MKKKIVSLILIFLILQYFCVFVFANDSVTNEITNSVTNNITDELEKQKEEVEDKLKEANIELEYVQGEMSDTMLKVQETEDKILKYKKEVAELGEKMDTLQKSIDESTAKLQIASQNYEEKSDMLARRLVAMYEAGDTQYLDVLLKSKSITEFISRYYIIQEVAEYDSILINEVEQEKNNIEQTKQKLENEQAEIKIVKAKNEQTTIVLSNMQTLQKSYINELSADEKKLQEQITEYKNDQAEIERQILLATNVINPDIQYTGGEMLWPVAISGTVITSDYGVREHPIQGVIKEHTGIDIGNTPTGTPVVAAADGVVTYAGWLGGYGNCVMINHGEGVVTLYGHGNKILTSVNKKVKKGETIMEVGSTGNSTGPHLHFEVRVNGSCTSPWQFVKAPTT
jgi:murein DD-endopeptidase MepM/ murein hydrolase activator NlpD